MSARDWTTTSAKYAAAFALGAASLGGLAWSLNRRPPAAVHSASATESRAVVREVIAAPEPEVTEAPVAKPVIALPHSGNPTSSERAAEEPEPKPLAVGPHKINLNTATQAELELLPGIGPALAKRILDFRTANGKFATVDQLDSVKGIGPKILEKLRPLVSVE